MSKALTKTALTAAVTTALLAGAAVTSTASAEVSANIGFTSNYIFRGVTESDDGAAVQGGIDYEHEGGFYVGTWISSLGETSVDSVQCAPGPGQVAASQAAGECEVSTSADRGGYEMDLYFGVAGEVGTSGVGFDIGYIYYAYPAAESAADANFGEIYGGLDYMGFYGLVNFVTNADDSDLESSIAYEVGYGFDLMDGYSLGGTVGYVDWDDSDWEDYTWWSLHVSKATDFGDFTLAYTQNDTDEDDDPRFNVSYVMSF
ncbi:MAG: hypothetical protein EA372_06215 [Chromatiaceae bacterium]|nr:MAG: hypothetical protein EA372_06215 [Chromatiaceae bacterium]